MLIIIFVISLALITLGCVLGTGYDDRAITIRSLGIILFISSVIALIIVGIKVSKLSVIDERTAMYQEENTKIEEQIAEAVSQYQEYETGIFEKVAPDKAVLFVTLYPDLKSDTLVQSQIAVYVENNNMIKQLKDDGINGDVLRWWLYFGGKKVGN